MKLEEKEKCEEKRYMIAKRFNNSYFPVMKTSVPSLFGFKTPFPLGYQGYERWLRGHTCATTSQQCLFNKTIPPIMTFIIITRYCNFHHAKYQSSSSSSLLLIDVKGSTTVRVENGEHRACIRFVLEGKFTEMV